MFAHSQAVSSIHLLCNFDDKNLSFIIKFLTFPHRAYFSGHLSTIIPEVLYVKKNLFSDKRKGSKGFYAALGISAVMIGSACYYAYDQGEKISREFMAEQSAQEDAAVGRRVTGVPKATAPTVRRTAPPVITAPPIVTAPPVRTLSPAPVIPAAPADTQSTAAVRTDNSSITRMENVKPPLDDVSNIITIFSGKELVKNETTGSWQTHNGTDFAADIGADVYAVSNGYVASVQNDPLWGVTVVIDHNNGFVTKYCGLSDQLSVQIGDMVVSGAQIGTVGNTADIESALPPHLHMEVLRGGIYVDPVDAITQ